MTSWPARSSSGENPGPMMLTEEFGYFISEHWLQDDAQWFARLNERGWLTFTLPPEHGGCPWDRETQLAFVHQMVAAGCPLLPVSVTRIAPVIAAVGNDRQLRQIDDIRMQPLDWRISESMGAADRQLLIRPSAAGQSLYLNEELLGPAGQAEHLLATSVNAIHLIFELAATISLTESMHVYWDDPPTDTLTLQEVQLTAIESQYLAGSDNETLCTQLEPLRATAFHLLFDALGYYALLSPDPHLAGNEPLPFAYERRHLASLQQQIAVDADMLKNRTYTRQLAGESP